MDLTIKGYFLVVPESYSTFLSSQEKYHHLAFASGSHYIAIWVCVCVGGGKQKAANGLSMLVCASTLKTAWVYEFVMFLFKVTLGWNLSQSPMNCCVCLFLSLPLFPSLCRSVFVFLSLTHTHTHTHSSVHTSVISTCCAGSLRLFNQPAQHSLRWLYL